MTGQRKEYPKKRTGRVYDKCELAFDLLIVIFTVIATVVMLKRAGNGAGLMTSGLKNLKYYTVLSNEFCGIVALTNLIGTILGRKIKGMLILKFIAATVTGLTFLIIACFLQPAYPQLDMYQNANWWFHLVIPITAMLQFLLMDIGKGCLPFKATFLNMIPSAVYGIGYTINILINGIGVWPDTNDWYGFLNWGWGAGIGIFIGIIFLTWIVGLVLRLLNRVINRIRLWFGIFSHLDSRIIFFIFFLAAAVIIAVFFFRSNGNEKENESASEYPAFSGSPYVEVNGNQPYFTDEEKGRDTFESYSPLDKQGRCGPAFACVSRELMPTEPRGQIGNVRPSGWVQEKYEGIIDSKPPYLYNRCHLIAYCLTAENDNEENLITGTRYLNVEGMLPFEEKVAGYLDEHDYHVLYRVTPVFRGDNLLADGVLMEAYSIEDQGEGICFCVYCYNVQPGITIDYASGKSRVTQ